MTNLEKFRKSILALSVLDEWFLSDSLPADVIRDASDSLWLALSEAERESLRNTPSLADKADLPSDDAKSPPAPVVEPVQSMWPDYLTALCEDARARKCQQQSG